MQRQNYKLQVKEELQNYKLYFLLLFDNNKNGTWYNF